MKAANTNEALALWKRVAAGERGADLDLWLQGVAGRVVSEVFEAKFEHAARRAEAAQAAVGWRGRLNPHEELDALAVADFTQGSSARAVANAAPLIVDVKGTAEQIEKRVEYARRGKR
ncbi:MAG: hypothetical protein H0W40_11335 [Methylibium sp.]|uniref:hypothetical protein n=1 Tax=Methylibium sp. TaxID=2067992 RepID=UPI00178E264A|nr:hypothetical protein [Methylibium sp.]MBA3597950.1 hypothetical protein [Methylibium sp.]